MANYRRKYFAGLREVSSAIGVISELQVMICFGDWDERVIGESAMFDFCTSRDAQEAFVGGMIGQINEDTPIALVEADRENFACSGWTRSQQNMSF